VHSRCEWGRVKTKTLQAGLPEFCFFSANPSSLGSSVPIRVIRGQTLLRSDIIQFTQPNMKKTTILLLAAVATALLTSCATKPVPVAPGYVNDSDDFDNDIPKNEVPANVLAAAKAEIPGFILEEANLQQRGATRLFELQGRANDRPYELDITADGRVLHIERD
jgi:hypothetical protein